MAVCPKCGCEDATFRRETAGVSSNSRYRKSVVLPTGTRNTQRNISHRTIAVCPKCGYTWEAEDATRSTSAGHGAGFWILAVLFFPISLSIWFWKTDKIKLDKKIKAIILAVVWIGLIVSSILSDKQPQTADDTGASIEVSETIYADDAEIDQFLCLYNKTYPENPVRSVEKYYHHGSYHDNQVIYNDGDAEIVLSHEGSKVSIYFDNPSKDDNETAKALFSKYMKLFNFSLDENTIELYWNNQIESGVSSLNTYGDIECQTEREIESDLLQYAKISGKLG